MDRFEAMRVFVRIVELSSFTKAADELKLPRATVTHTIQQLEGRLGVRLLHRTTRQVSATPDGEAYYHRCLQLLNDLDEAESAFSHSAIKPRGKLRVDLQGTIARHFLLPHLGAFFEAYPDIEMEIGLGDRLVDLVRESIDCVVRAGEPRDSSLVSRRVASLPVVTCASAGYLDRYGTPLTLEAFAEHHAVNFANAGGRIMPFEFMVNGEQRLLSMPGRVTVSHSDAYLACCMQGLGFAQIPRYHVEELLEDGVLREVLPVLRPLPMPVSAMYPHHRQLSPRVRVFVDWVAQCMEPL